MWNHPIYLCVILFGSAANSMDDRGYHDMMMDIDQDDCSGGSAISAIPNSISIEADVIRMNIENEINSFIFKAKSIYSNLVKIATNIKDVSVADCDVHVMKIYTNGEKLILNTAKCIKEDEESLINLLEYCERLSRRSEIETDADAVDESFFKEAGNTETNIKRTEIKKKIYYDAIITFGTNDFSFEDMIHNFKQSLMYCQTEERDEFYAATLRGINSMECNIKKMIEGSRNVPAATSMDIDDKIPNFTLKKQKIADYISIEAKNIDVKNTYEILKILLKINPDYVDLVCQISDVKVEIKNIINSHLTGTNLILTTTTCIKEDLKNMMRVPSVASTDNVQNGCIEAEHEKIKIKEKLIDYLSSAINNNFRLEGVMDEIKKLLMYWQIDQRILSYVNVKKNIKEAHHLLREKADGWSNLLRPTEGDQTVPDANPNEPRINYLSTAELSSIAKTFASSPTSMARCLVTKLLSEKQLIEMSVDGRGNRKKIPPWIVQSVKNFVNAHADSKHTDKLYKQTFNNICSSLRNQDRRETI